MPSLPESIPAQSNLADHHCHLIDNRPCGRNLYIMTLRAVHTAFGCTPGQFVMLDLPQSKFYFRRPFSVLAAYEDNVFDLFYKVVGEGTQMMSRMVSGEEVTVLGPLGKGFVLPAVPDKTLMIGGGIGIAPLYFVAKHYLAQGEPKTPHCIYGVQSAEDLGISTELGAVIHPAHLHCCTDDGTWGFHGNVLQLLQQQESMLLGLQNVMICGPTRMMEACVAYLQENHPLLNIQVSLEEHMPCGTGACTGCVVPRPNGQLPVKTCLEGPVFNARNLLWPWQTEGGQENGQKEGTPCCR